MQNLITVNPAEVFILCKRVKNNHVAGVKMIDYAPEFKLEEQMKYDETDEKENLKFDHLQ